MGGKYKWKPDENPPVGGYDLDAGYNQTSFHNRSVTIKPATSPYRRPQEQTPEPGRYDGHLTSFGSRTKSFTIGTKKPAVYDKNPGVGYYNPDDSITKSKVKFAVIKEETYKMPKRLEGSPDPGQYDGHLTGFGSTAKSFTIGQKQPDTYDRNPGVGYYNPNDSVTKSRVQAATIKEATVKYTRPKESNPSPGQYDGHLTAFG